MEKLNPNRHYITGCDPYDRLNWLQRQLKKIGFYKNRPKTSMGVFRWREDGTVEFVEVDRPNEEQVLAFIKYLNGEIHHRPQCMMLAMLLKVKFSQAILLYNNSHFITEIDGKCYDWDGVAERKPGFVEFLENYGDNHIVNHYYGIKARFLSKA